jgi:thymidylate synthase (FAD)
MNKVSLVAHTVPVIEQLKSANDLVAFCARVSNPENQLNTNTSDGLLRYCMREGHWSIFEMANVVLEIQTTRDIARQLLRHRSFSFQEFSQRYAKVNNPKPVIRKARVQDEKNRQNSIPVEDSSLAEFWWSAQDEAWENAYQLYENALGRGIAKEQARALLPEGLTRSTLYVNGTLRSWIHYVTLRTGNGTQQEHMDLARKCAETIKPIFPIIDEFVVSYEEEVLKDYV